MPDEYDPYYYHIPEEDDGLVKALEHTMSLAAEELGEMGLRALKYVCKNKSPKKQARKIMQLFT